MMWVRLSCLAALSTVAGCESIAVSPALFGPESSYGYAPAPSLPQPPAPPAPAGLDARATGAIPPAGALPAAPADPAARAVILPVVPDPAEVASTAVYDHRRDPYVTSVLLPPASDAISATGGPRTEDGRPILPPTKAPRVIELGSVRSGLEASAAQD